MGGAPFHVGRMVRAVYEGNRKIGYALLLGCLILASVCLIVDDPYLEILKKLMVVNVIVAGLLTGRRGGVFVGAIAVGSYLTDFRFFEHHLFDGPVDVGVECGFLLLLGYLSGTMSGLYLRSSVRAELQRHKIQSLVRDVGQKTEMLHTSNLNVIECLVQALEAKDPYIRGHSRRVRDLAVALAKQMRLPASEIELIHHASLLHDVGKIGVCDGILTKAGKLSTDELAVLQAHPVVADEILGPLGFMQKHSLLIRHHHERFDGKGYPDGLKGDEIPLGSRIIMVADSFDAMTADRPYRKRLPGQHVIAELVRNRGTQFDPKVVDTLLLLIEKEERRLLQDHAVQKAEELYLNVRLQSDRLAAQIQN